MHLDARAQTRRCAREGFARGGSARRASSGRGKARRSFCDGKCRKAHLLQCLAWPLRYGMSMGSAGAKESVRWSERVSSSCDPAPRMERAVASLSSSRRAWSPRSESELSADKKPLSPPRSDLPVFPSNAESGLDTATGENETADDREGLFRSSFRLLVGDGSKPTTRSAGKDSVRVSPSPFSPHWCAPPLMFSANVVPLPACRPGRARELTARRGRWRLGSRGTSSETLRQSRRRQPQAGVVRTFTAAMRQSDVVPHTSGHFTRAVRIFVGNAAF